MLGSILNIGDYSFKSCAIAPELNFIIIIRYIEMMIKCSLVGEIATLPSMR